VCLEFLPWTAVAQLATAWALVQKTGLANVGLVLDTWHFRRQPGGPDYEVLEAIPGDRVRYVQVSDAAAEPEADLMTEALTRRLLPGDGVIDFDRLQSSLAAIGADPVYATEVYNTPLALTGAQDIALALQQAVRGISLGRSGAPGGGSA
jgi:sugar phosphate isomerase/epimerase